MRTLIADQAYDPAWTDLAAGALNPGTDPGALVAFNNTLKMTNSVPIGSTTPADQAVVAQNAQRALLIIQNNSTATSPDYAPTFYIGFGVQANVGYDLALPPGVGIVLDVRVPIDAVYVAFGPYSGSSVVIQGVIKEGGITDPSHDTANSVESRQLEQLIQLVAKAMGIKLPGSGAS